MAKKIKIDRELYDKFHDMMSNQRIIDALLTENKELNNKVDKYKTSYLNTLDTKIKLFEENIVLKDLINKEQDTQIIKYQGKLYRIENITHYSGAGEADTLTVYATSYSEVNMDG